MEFTAASRTSTFKQFRFKLRYFSGHAAHIPWRWEAWVTLQSGEETLYDAVGVFSNEEPIYALQFLTNRLKAYGFLAKDWQPNGGE